MFYKVEYAMDGKADDILAWLEKDIQTIEDYDNGKIRVIFRAKRGGNKIVVTGTMYKMNEASMPVKISGFGECEGFTFNVLRISDERSKIEGLIAHQNMFVEKLFYTYLARLGDAFDAGWRADVRTRAESLREEIEKEQGWHWGTVERADEETGQVWTSYGVKIPNEPEMTQNSPVPHYDVSRKQISSADQVNPEKEGSRHVATIGREKKGANSELVNVISERTAALNKLAVLWVTYNQKERISKQDDMEWFIGENARAVGLNYLSVTEFKKHLPKAYKAGIIEKDPKSRRYIPKLAT